MEACRSVGLKVNQKRKFCQNLVLLMHGSYKDRTYNFDNDRDIYHFHVRD